jgi:hypothetical protein
MRVQINLTSFNLAVDFLEGFLEKTKTGYIFLRLKSFG